MRTAMSGGEKLDSRELLSVLTAFRRGDFTVRMTPDKLGMAGKIADSLNSVLELNERMAKEFDRISKVVGKEGRITQRATLGTGEGAWATCVDAVNTLISDLAQPSTEIARVISAVAKGDLSQSMSLELDGRPLKGEFLKTAKVVNTMVDQLNLFASEVTRVAREVGTEGKLGGQADVHGVAGTWKDLTESVNSMGSNLTNQVRNIAQVTTAVARGDLSTKITVDARGEILALKNTINTMVDQLSSFASEVTRVAREVGTEGKLGGQADVKGVAGVWKDLTESVNSMAGNLTNQVRNIATVTTAVARGDLSRKITVDAQGEILELKDTINTMVDQLNSFASEVTRVAREVGTEGILGGQAEVGGVAGTWRDLTISVNSMASNLTDQVRNIAMVTTAVADGDLSTKITVNARGEILELKNTINTMVDQLGSFASEVTRVAREVGTEGKLGGQADVKGIAGTWKDLTDSVNSMASNLTDQVRNIAHVTTAVANGDLSRKITVDARGEILELKNTINTMVDQLNWFASEVTRVAREVGTEGKLGGQAEVRGVAGTWRDLTDSVNSMASNLTNQVRNIAEVTTAVARGDLSTKITVDVRGEILELKNTINTMVDQLGSFASEVTRVAREVGTEGILGGQADVKGVAGTWRDLTESVNSMASNLTNQVRNIAAVTTAVANGDLSREITVDARGEILELKNTINTMVDQLNAFAGEVTRVAREVGTEGKLGGQADVRGVAGTWKDLTESVNSMASNLTNQVRNIAAVTTAVANGDLSREITVDARGEILELKDTINTMVGQLNSFASEVTRVAREVGTEGKLGGQAAVRGGAGVWKDLTESVNSMASNLTTQVRGIAKVVTAVANGDLKRKLVLETKGEISELAETINGMIDTLAVFADQVTSVAREVGVEGKLGGQALVPGAAGIWRDLTNNVNQLAANLTGQVRAIAEVATAVTKGDLTRSISVEASGEVAALRDNINTMILSLRETTRKNTEQDWLKTNLARFTRMVQGQRDLLSFSRLVMSELAPLVNAQQGLFFMTNGDGGVLKLFASYAFRERKGLNNQIRFGEGLVGQCALEKTRILMTDVPSDYIRINSGLGEAPPYNIVVLPVLFEGEVMAVIELASFKPFNDIHIAFLDQLTESIGIVLNTIAATMRTEELLKQSQALAGELRSQQEELTSTNRRLEQQAATLQASEELLKSQQEQLQRTNQELQDKALLLAEQKAEVERKNKEVEQAKEALEEKAEQLALTSKYKSEFLANMSHELRTPLNNLLILARMLADNIEGNLSSDQIKFAETIHSSGNDLLALISDILDLSKIESGTMGVEVEEVPLEQLREYIGRSFKHVADEKGLQFSVELAAGAPGKMRTDARRLQQVLKNLISNAIKFTDRGRVRVRMELTGSGWAADHPVLSRAGRVIAFSVNDTGIGIPPQKQRIIFEAFQQADGTTSRKYGGTGLGLSISREIARLLGGEIALESVPGEGSTFTLYLPESYVAPGSAPRETPVQADVQPRLGRVEKHGSVMAPALRAKPAPVAQTDLTDDRDSLQPGDRTVLIIEDDITYARVILEGLHKRGMKGVVAPDGASALALAHEIKPAAITLDVFLPDTAGWTVLDRLKHDPETAHIPVHVISIDEDWHRVLALGAASHMEKSRHGYEVDPVLTAIERSVDRNRRPRLLAAGNAASAVGLVDHTDIDVTTAGSGAEALRMLEQERFDCLLVVPEPADIETRDFLQRLGEAKLDYQLPALVYTAQQEHPLPQSEAQRLCEKHLVRCAGSPEELIQNAAIHLHRRAEDLPEPQRNVLEQIRLVNPVLNGRRILVVDDDVRNVFALTSVLERYGMEVFRAEDGRSALDTLREREDVELVLLDIMMPGMDGYETARAIRKMPRHRDLPVIALTAKAMSGDREKCLEAGASDYVPKPVDLEELLSVLRVWLPPRQRASARSGGR